MSQVRSALVIATDQYQDSRLGQLRTPGEDARALASVLGDPSIGGFDVQTAINAPEANMRRELGRFFGDRGRNDLLLLYISCHGLKDESGQLYFATEDTELQNLAATALSAEFISQQMARSRSQAVVLLLDCCYSGAFTSGMTRKAGDGLDIGERFQGSGRVVITSSSAMEYAFEGDAPAEGKAVSSIFTSAIVRGLQSGDADFDQDGWITVDELYEYVLEQIREITPHQTPARSASVSGEIIIARSPRARILLPSGSSSNGASVPTELSEAIEHPFHKVRLGAIDELETLLISDDPKLASFARNSLEKLTKDDSQAVASRAQVALTHQSEPTAAADEEEYTPEPIIANDYWTVGDQLDYEPYAIAISEFIRHGETTPPLTIGIKAPWGAGKTSLMRMVQDRLDPPRQSTDYAVGNERRQQVTLTAASWRLIVGRSRRQRPAPPPGHRHKITNWTIIRKLRRQERGPIPGNDPLSADPSSEAESLKIEPPPPGWRPTVWFSPWMYQSGEQIWAGLAYEIISQLTERMRPGEREGFWLELNLRRVDGDTLRRRVHRALLERLIPVAGGLAVIALLATAVFFTHLIVPSAAHYLGVAAKGLLATGAVGAALAALFRSVAFWREHVAGSLTSLVSQPDYAKGWQQLAGGGKNGIFSGLIQDPDYESRLGYLHTVQTDMRRVLDLVVTKDRPVVVFVDDLDRCSPDAVAQVIEAINLFLAGQFPNCIFVIGMEPELVAAHIEVVYKPLVDTLGDDDYWGEARTLGWRFLDKIVQLPISLPVLRSDQASQFLGTSIIGVQKGADQGNMESRLDAGKLRQMEEAIRRRHPSIENLSEAAAVAEKEVAGASESATAFSAEAKEAMRRELKRRLHPDDPEVQAIVATVVGRLAKNPREIKRFVNVFRFYAVIRQEREAVGLPVPDTLTEIAKLAVLAVRWPHLRAALGRQVGATERDTVLSLLEAPIAELPENADWLTRRQALHTVLGDAQIPEKLRTNLLASEGLCELLASDPPIGTAAAGYL
jgi:KAP family P-loop domain/Caspase domain